MGWDSGYTSTPLSLAIYLAHGPHPITDGRLSSLLAESSSCVLYCLHSQAPGFLVFSYWAPASLDLVSVLSHLILWPRPLPLTQ